MHFDQIRACNGGREERKNSNSNDLSIVTVAYVRLFVFLALYGGHNAHRLHNIDSVFEMQSTRAAVAIALQFSSLELRLIGELDF